MLIFDTPPLVILAIGIVTILGLIIFFRVNAFLALIAAAFVVSLLAPGEVSEKISRVAQSFGGAAGNIGIVIALAAIIGQCMMDSGAADRIVRSFLDALGQKRAGVALLGSGYVLAIPVFFDTVFYLLIPLARSLYRRTRKDYLLYILAIGAGGAVTHTLVPPTPGPLLMAANLKIDVGTMILVGAMVGLPTALVGLGVAHTMNKLGPVEMRTLDDPSTASAPEKADAPEDSTGRETSSAIQTASPVSEHVAVGDAIVREASPSLSPESTEEEESQLPGLFVSALPILLPVLLISFNTCMDTFYKGTKNAEFAAVGGNANFALFLSAIVSMWVLVSQRSISLVQLGQIVEKALMSGGVIILITAGGGAFGAMLKAAQIGPAIEQLFGGQSGISGISLLVLGFGVACLLKVAQGSSTVAMITASAMLAAILIPENLTDASLADVQKHLFETLKFHPVYLATAIGGGSLVGSWMNDSGFWIVSKMSGLTEVETLKTWTILLVVLGVVAFGMSILLAMALPFPLGQ